MTHKEATKLCLETKWKTKVCNSGKECWCRLVVPIVDIKDDEGNEIYIVGSGCLPLVYAKHIVRLHNKHLKIKENASTLLNI